MAKKSKGTLLKIGDAANPGPEAFLTVGKIFSVGEVKKTRETIDVTTHDSPGDYKEFIGGLRDGGSVSFQYRLTPADAGQAEVKAADDEGELRNFRIEFPQVDYRWAFAALVTESGTQESGVEGVLNGTATLKISGPPVWEVIP